MIIMVEKRRFGSEWEDYELIPLGGFWAICVGLIKDNIGIRKVRIAKGKIKGKVWRNEKGQIEYKLDDPSDPITLVNRFNITKKTDWEKAKKIVEKYISKLEEK